MKETTKQRYEKEKIFFDNELKKIRKKYVKKYGKITYAEYLNCIEQAILNVWREKTTTRNKFNVIKAASNWWVVGLISRMRKNNQGDERYYKLIRERVKTLLKYYTYNENEQISGYKKFCRDFGLQTKKPKKIKRKASRLNFDNIITVYSHMTNEQFKLAYEIALLTGCRIGEINSTEVRVENGEIVFYIVRNKQKEKQKSQADKITRISYKIEEITQFFGKYKITPLVIQKLAREGEISRLEIKEKSLQKHIYRISRKHRTKNIQIHSLRNFFSKRIRQTCNVETVATALGHSGTQNLGFYSPKNSKSINELKPSAINGNYKIQGRQGFNLIGSYRGPSLSL